MQKTCNASAHLGAQASSPSCTVRHAAHATHATHPHAAHAAHAIQTVPVRAFFDSMTAIPSACSHCSHESPTLQERGKSGHRNAVQKSNEVNKSNPTGATSRCIQVCKWYQ